MARCLKNDDLPFNYDNVNQIKCTKFDHTEGCTHYKSLPKIFS